MKAMIYINRDGSYDIVNCRGVLCRLHMGKLKVIGKVNERWTSPGRLVHGIPPTIASYFYQAQTIKISNNANQES
jgi:hypothetical protein